VFWSTEINVLHEFMCVVECRAKIPRCTSGSTCRNSVTGAVLSYFHVKLVVSEAAIVHLEMTVFGGKSHI